MALHPVIRQLGLLEAMLALLVVAGLALPFLPMPWEHETRIAVRFRTADMTRPGGFTVQTSSTVCYVLSAILPYRDPASGGFVQIDCGKRAMAPARQVRTERTALHTTTTTTGISAAP